MEWCWKTHTFRPCLRTLERTVGHSLRPPPRIVDRYYLSTLVYLPYWQYMLPQWGHEALHWHMFAARRALHAKSHRSRYTGFYIAAVLFLLLQDFLLRPVLNFSQRGTRAFTVFSLFCNEKIAAPRRTRVTNSTKICRNSLVARYAVPPCVTRYAATYIASTVLLILLIGVRFVC